MAQAKSKKAVAPAKAEPTLRTQAATNSAAHRQQYAQRTVRQCYLDRLTREQKRSVIFSAPPKLTMEQARATAAKATAERHALSLLGAQS